MTSFYVQCPQLPDNCTCEIVQMLIDHSRGCLKTAFKIAILTSNDSIHDVVLKSISSLDKVLYKLYYIKLN